jgi:hypothetical protein
MDDATELSSPVTVSGSMVKNALFYFEYGSLKLIVYSFEMGISLWFGL